MKNYCLAICAAVMVLSGCSQASTHSSALPDLGSAGRSAGAPAGATGPFLYVGSGVTGLAQYALGDSKPRRVVATQAYVGALAFDSSGHLFASGGGVSQGLVAIYDARTLSLLRSIGLAGAEGLATDSSGYLFVANCSFIAEYAPGETKTFHVYHDHVGGTCVLAFDRSGDLYAAGQHSIAILEPAQQPGLLKYSRSIVKGVNSPVALAFGPSGDLFVANCLRCAYSSPPRPDSVTVYAPGASSPSRTITRDVKGPVALAIDAQNRLFVANVPLPNGKRPGWVSLYAPDGTQPLLTITNHVRVPVSLAIDQSGDLYVANEYGNSVTVYGDDGKKLLQSINHGVRFPASLAIGPP